MCPQKARLSLESPFHLDQVGLRLLSAEHSLLEIPLMDRVVCKTSSKSSSSLTLVVHRCGGPNPATTGGKVIGQRPGDWRCPGCQDIQFAKNTECRRCGTANPDPESSMRALEAFA